MKLRILLLMAIICVGELSAQTPFIGHSVFTFNDSTRTGGFGSGGGAGRQIQCEVYYPSTSSTGGDNVPIAAGQYPVLVFGHGFVMVWSSYDNIWTDLVPQGYVIAFPRTEGSFSPVHSDFGKDLALVADRMIGEGNNPANFLYTHLINKSAIMGHSMGGGSAFLACANNTNVTTMVTFAAANTNPSSIAVAVNVSVPTLVISGQNDCVAPPPANQDSMYLKTGAACKAEVTIKGAGHCAFANNNTNCLFGEGTCTPQPTISTSLQKTIASVYYSNWLAYFLKNDCNAWNTFNDSLAMSSAIIGVKNCPLTCSAAIGELTNNIAFTIFPNPVLSTITISLPQRRSNEIISLQIHDELGRVIKMVNGLKQNEVIDVSSLERGIYFISIMTGNEVFKKTFVKS